MIRLVITGIATLAAMALWAAALFIGTSEGWWHRPMTSSAAPADFVQAARTKVETGHRGNLGFALIENGKPVENFSWSTGSPVDENSVYQVASLGKWITAWGVMALVEDGLVDLDAPVENYLERWTLPESKFDHEQVTVRRLLSHTAGLDDRLGYNGFATPDAVQTLEDSLTRAADASPGKSGVVRVGETPGAAWNYSGGGYTLLQLMVEEVSGLSFPEYMEQRIFTPLGMTRTTFDHQKAQAMGLAENFTLDGDTEPFRWYTALAATSLFTTPADMTTFALAQLPGSQQKILSQNILATMATPHASSLGADIWGLGPMLLAPDNKGGFIIGHDGKNEPAINSAVRVDPASGDGIVILETGSPILATTIASEWVFWKTGNVDNLAFAARMDGMFTWILFGCIAILIVGLLVGWRQMRRLSRKRRQSA
jgi:CubicO group peptidase (beta-lactamase class C family)